MEVFSAGPLDLFSIFGLETLFVVAPNRLASAVNDTFFYKYPQPNFHSIMFIVTSQSYEHDHCGSLIPTKTVFMMLRGVYNQIFQSYKREADNSSQTCRLWGFALFIFGWGVGVWGYAVGLGTSFWDKKLQIQLNPYHTTILIMLVNITMVQIISAIKTCHDQ